VSGATTTATIGPHGDLVESRERSEGDIARWSDVRAAHAARPLRPVLLAGYEWPTRNARLTNAFGTGRPSSFLLDGVVFHDGIDIASFCGARITAAHDGIVLGAGRRNEGLLGWVGDLAPFRAKVEAEDAWGRQAITVVIDDGNGYRSIYAHLGLAVVKRGETVAAGDLLGYEGASGNATGCHLHYALFDPRDEGRLTLEPKTARKTRLPAQEIARIDPLLVLPPLEAGGITWGWGAR
jgi:murein DD-endopeptidase MepM/ murein hydrolase activator NlpD